MQLRVEDIKEHRSGLHIEQPVEQYPILAQLVKDEGYVFTTPVQIDVHVSIVGGVIELDGHVRVDVEIPVWPLSGSVGLFTLWRFSSVFC